ncbi:MAG: response regulator [Desulfobacteraceae bacterium]|nr:MAG: response regulator [Desulfobacteraceae bacterium]
MPDNEAPKPIKILVVEDYPTNREIIRSYLSGDRYALRFAENGQQALEAIRNETLDLILMDVQMPVMDGFEATRAIRAWEAGHRQAASVLISPPSSFILHPSSFSPIPIIAMTAQVLQEEEEKFYKAGMDDYIGKPFRKKELRALVAKWIRPV